MSCRAEPLVRNSCLTQGLLLVTPGFITRFSGLQLALILAVESVVLLMIGQQRKNRVLLTGAYAAAGLAVGWGIDGMRLHDASGVYLGVGIGALMLANTLMVHHRSTASGSAPLRPGISYFAALALLAWLVTTWDNCDAHFPVVLAAEGLLLTLSIYLLRVPEISLFAQGYVVLALFARFWPQGQGGPGPRWWETALLTAMTLGLGHWWQWQKAIALRSRESRVWQAAYSLAIIALLYVWLVPEVEPPSWLALSSLLAVGLTVYGVLTRAWFLAASAQLFLVVSGVQFVWQLSEANPPWQIPLVPIATLGLLLLAR